MIKTKSSKGIEIVKMTEAEFEALIEKKIEHAMKEKTLKMIEEAKEWPRLVIDKIRGKVR